MHVQYYIEKKVACTKGIEMKLCDMQYLQKCTMKLIITDQCKREFLNSCFCKFYDAFFFFFFFFFVALFPRVTGIPERVTAICASQMLIYCFSIDVLFDMAE